MMLVDSRIGSGDLLEPLQKHLNGQARSAMLDSGDVAWDGWGPDGEIIIGAEMKALADMLTSMRSGRYIDQLNRMLETYQIIYLFIEGVWRPSEDGLIETATRGGWALFNLSTQEQAKRGRRAYYSYSELDKFLCSLEMKRSVIVRRIPRFPRSSRHETVTQLVNLYNWWQKPWDDHHSVEAVKLQSGSIVPGKASVCRMVAAQLPGIGWNRSIAVENKFRTVENMVNALPSEWQEIDGIGKKTALTVYAAIRKEKE